MSTTCAICMALGRLPLGPLLPNIVTYRGYSLCMEHMQLWEGCRREDGTTAEWEDVMAFARAPVVVKVDLSETDSAEEKQEKIKEAGKEFLAAAEFDLDRSEAFPYGMSHAPDEYDEAEKEMAEEDVEEAIFLKDKPRKRRGKKTYVCEHCGGKRHSYNSKIGKKHIKWRID